MKVPTEFKCRECGEWFGINEKAKSLIENGKFGDQHTHTGQLTR